MTERDGRNAIKSETARLHFLSDFFEAVAVEVLLKLLLALALRQSIHSRSCQMLSRLRVYYTFKAKCYYIWDFITLFLG